MAELKYTPVPHNHDQFLARLVSAKASLRHTTRWKSSTKSLTSYSKLELVRASPRTLSLSAWAQQRAQSLDLKQPASMHPLSQP